jgi:hypothetical protein
MNVKDVLKIPSLVPLLYCGGGGGRSCEVLSLMDIPFLSYLYTALSMLRWDVKNVTNINVKISLCIFCCERQQSTLKNQDRNSSVSTLNRLRELEFDSWHGQGFFSTANRQVLGHTQPPSLLSNQHRGSFHGQSGRGGQLTTHFDLARRLRMNNAVTNYRDDNFQR